MIMMMMVKLIIYMMFNLRNPSITDRLIIDVIHYCNLSTNDFRTVLSIDDSATTATATTSANTTSTNTTNADVVSNKRRLTDDKFRLFCFGCFFFKHRKEGMEMMR